MKTQIITTVFAIALSMSLNESVANDNLASKSKKADMFQEQVMNIEETVISEENLSIEAWMTDEALWKVDAVSSTNNTEVERPLSIEPWMYSNECFRIEDSRNAIESWMLDDSLWRF